MTARMQQEIESLYEKYDFHPAVSRLQTFCSEDLGAFYLDVLKDRLYTSAPNSLPRRSAQTALLHITQSLLRLLAPILSFTAEEAWAVLGQSSLRDDKHINRKTIFAECFYAIPNIDEADRLATRWTRLREIRAMVMRKLEELRSVGSIGSSLQAEVDIRAGGDDLDLLQSVSDQLFLVFIVSRASVHASESGDIDISITPSTHQKCERCWHWREDVGHDPAHAGICGRCTDSLQEAGLL